MMFIFLIVSGLTKSFADHDTYTASVGAGIGMPYAVIGVKIDYSPIEDLYFSLGLTVTNIIFGVNPDYSVGIQYYFRSQKKVWRPRISFFYGPVEFIDLERDGHQVSETFYGTALELGSSIQFGYERMHGVDVGIIIPLTDGGKDERERELKEQGYSYCCDTSFTKGLYFIGVGYRLNF